MDASLYETIPLGLLDRNHSKAYYYNSLHYGSDAGAEMAVTYHSVIGMIKFHSSSIWNFIGTFFKNIFNGYKDYVKGIDVKTGRTQVEIDINIFVLVRLSSCWEIL